MQDRYLIDKSALARWSKPPVKDALQPLHERYLLAVCQPTEYEMVHSARTTAEALRISTWLHAFDYLTCDDDTFARALETQRHALNMRLPPRSVPPRSAHRRHRRTAPADRPPLRRRLRHDRLHHRAADPMGGTPGQRRPLS